MIGIDDLMAAAIYAGSLSHSRRKKIRLELGASGLAIHGEFFDEAGEELIWNHSHYVTWAQIMDGSVPLKDMIRRVDQSLCDAWRAMSAGPERKRATFPA